jgi:serine/threonine-protein kinase
LEAAHARGIVHRDIKPSNVLLSSGGRVKVADFGIAQAMSEATQHTSDSQIWGTPHYFSPEQAAGKQATPASDVYAIGVVFFELLTGQLPFTADTQTALALKHIYEAPPRASAVNPAVPYQLDQILQKVLAKEPSSRYRTADQLGRILSAYRESSLQETGPVSLVDLAALAPVYEQSTAVFELPTSVQVVPGASVPEAPAGTTAAVAERDGLALALGILAVLALLGLIPLWYFVYQAYTG